VKVLEFYQNDKFFFIVTEYLEGGELFDRIMESSTFSEEKACHVMQQLLSAVLYLHKHSIIHRDLKPENVIFETRDPNSKVKVIDFGTSTYFDKGTKLHKKLGTVPPFDPALLHRARSPAEELRRKVRCVVMRCDNVHPLVRLSSVQRPD